MKNALTVLIISFVAIALMVGAAVAYTQRQTEERSRVCEAAEATIEFERAKMKETVEWPTAEDAKRWAILLEVCHYTSR